MSASSKRDLPRLQEYYRKHVVAELVKQFGYQNPMEVPRIAKITINMGVGDAAEDKKHLTKSLEELKLIAGQLPVATYAKTSIAGFKIREGWPIGCKVTLRGVRMWEFLDKLLSIALPRVRDFRGLNPRSYDGRGNYTMGIKEQLIFMEIAYDMIEKVRGMDITITTTATTNEEGHALLRAMQFPFREVANATEAAK